MSPSMFIDAKSVFVPSTPYGDSPVRYRCQGCGEVIRDQQGPQHGILDCLEILAERIDMQSKLGLRR